MVLQAAYTLVTHILPSGYYWHIFGSAATLVVTYAFAQGRTTNRERDLHARTILITGAFSPTGLTLLSDLASRGAHIIALSDYPLDHPQPSLLIPALRETTKNPNIFADYADLTSPVSIRGFCTKFLTGDDQRLDAIVYAHEYACIGSVWHSKEQLQEKRDVASLATFLLTTLLLPALLVASVERDIRIIHLVNPFYAASIRSFTPELIASMSDLPKPPASETLFLREGYRALRTVVLARHLQRILNALPNRAPTLDPQFPAGVSPAAGEPSSSTAQETSSSTPAQPADQPKLPSNIVAVSVCPGISRSETIRKVLGVGARSPLFLILYIILYPVIWLLAKSSNMAAQTALHALFLPTPFKRALAHLAAATDPASAEHPTKGANIAETQTVTEILKPGALYRECSVVALSLPPLPELPKEESAGDRKKQKQTDKDANAPEEFDLEDDGEYGGEGVGRVVWEWYETRLKAWEANFKDSNSTESKLGAK